MIFEPKDVCQKLEFDKIRELLRRDCLTEMAAEEIAQRTPSLDFQ